MLPLAMPVSTIAINLINALNVPTVFTFYQPMIGTYWILPIAYMITAMPLLMRTNCIAFERFNSELEYASRSLGASLVKTYVHVTIPVVAPAIIAGGGTVFVRYIGEHTMSALLYGVFNRPISIAMVNAMQEYDIGLSMAYGTLTLSVCFIILGIVHYLDESMFG